MKKQRNTSARQRLSPSKQRAFRIAMLFSPLLLFLAIEFFLRLLNYGGDLNLVTKRIVNGKEVYSINHLVARRYFSQLGPVIPEPADDTFAIKKSHRTKRIFCLGESTMAGFPYEHHATAPSLLRDRLRAMLPQYDVEVINVGLSAIGTFVIQDFLDELLEYEPDLFVVYAGHNEFYGIYGVGASITIPGGPWLTRLTLSLLKFKSFLLLREAYEWLGQSPSGDQQKQSQSLMGQMARNQMIPFHSEEYRRGRELYHDNLVRLITTAQSHNIPIMFGTLVSNWRNQKPFVSAFDAATPPSQQALWQGMIAEGDSALSQRDGETAVRRFANAATLDSMNADSFFKLGQAFYALSRFDEARQALLRAKDLDALRFRATEEFQNDLITTCTQYNVPLARIDSSFVSASPHGILDNALFLEHLHPNIDGYFLMAKTFCQAIRNNNLLVTSTDWERSTTPLDSTLWDLSRVTEFDKAVGNVKIDLLTRRWPFETGRVNYQFVASNSVESVVFRMMKGDIPWSDARYLLAEFYARSKQFQLARRECLAVAKVFPFSYDPLMRNADYYLREGKKDEAKTAYEQCIETDDNPFARMKYAALLLEEENAAAAIAHIGIALDLDAKRKYTLPLHEAATARYLLGVSYMRIGKINQARENLQRALAIDPQNKETQQLLVQLKGR